MIEVGEFVRTRDGQIVKLENNEEFYEDSVDVGIGIIPAVDGIWIDKEYFDYIEKKNIAKHSKNIIDLIEIGDYVNGYRVLEKTKIKNNEMQICILKDNNCSNWRTVNDKTLKSIVTKEQFASTEYRAEEEWRWKNC